MRTRSLSLALLVMGLALPAGRAAEKVTLDGLLRQMTDLSLLAEYPDPPYVTRQFSSYDRASEAPGNENWFANADRGFTLYDGVVKDKTPYYRDPMRESGPNGAFAAGTKVGFSPTHKPVGDYVWAYATGPDGGAIDGKTPQGYIQKEAVTPDAQGHVLAEMDGPGCVVRIWSADPADAGNVRVYLDEAKDPVIEAPLAELLAGKWKTKIDGKETTPFPDPIACERSRGFNLYFPIAYARHCKITVDKSDLYYHVDYRTYPKGTEVESFSFSGLAAADKRISEVRNALADPFAGPVRYDPDTLVLTPHMVTSGDELPPPELPGKIALDKKFGFKMSGNSVQWEGAGAVQVLYVRVGNVKDLAETLRTLVLVGTFDGADQPQIWCPLGDFFGTGPGANPYTALPFRVRRSGTTADFLVRWVMPFEKTAVFTIQNYGKEYIAGSVRPGIDKEDEIRSSSDKPYVGWRIGSAPSPWTERSMHFHAKWRTADMKTRPFHDWTYCDLKGKGVFVGDMLSVMNPTPAWWGEGDEKIFVDGEKFPSFFGTGSEDYYGYAWSNPEPFSHAYHNQTRCDGKGTGATFGLTSVNRFHILDAIPFEKSFRFDMECWHWAPDVTVNYAATSYWYARPGATDDFEPTDAKVLQTIPAAPPPYKIEGALEGESLKVLGKSSEFPLGPQALQGFADGKWSGDAQLWGRPTKTGEFADLELPVPADGTFHLVVYLTKARDYGVLQFSVDGKPLGKPIDCFEPEEVLATGPLDLGAVELKKGKAVLRVEVVGTNEKSVGARHMWGLDCVVLKPAP